MLSRNFSISSWASFVKFFVFLLVCFSGFSASAQVIPSTTGVVAISREGQIVRDFANVTFYPQINTGTNSERWVQEVGTGTGFGFLSGKFTSARTDDLAAICFADSGASHALVTKSPGNTPGVVWQNPLTAGDKLSFYFLPGDFNGDGFEDLAMFYTGVTTDAPDDVRVKISFGPRGQVQTSDVEDWFLAGRRTSAFVSGDFISTDGIEDILAISRDVNGNFIGNFFAGPEGNLVSEINWNLGSGIPVAFRPGDFNGDGIVDLAVFLVSTEGAVTVRIVQGPTGIIENTEWPLGNESFKNFLVEDFDQNGKTDVAGVFADQNSSKVRVVHNPSSAIPTTEFVLTGAEAEKNIVSVVAGRFSQLSIQTFALRGKVSFGNGVGASGVEVTVGPVSAITDSQGNFEITGLSSGTYNLVATRLGTIVSPLNFTNPVVLTSEDLDQFDFSASCSSSFVQSASICILQGSSPTAPKELLASDGTSPDFVLVSWKPVDGAIAYKLFRSQFAGERGIELTGPLSGVIFQDPSAVPGVTYYYSVVALNQFGESELSNVDSGFRASDTGFSDCDGDGVSDEQEQIDGTMVCDPGSFQLHLKSPAFTKYNTFLKQFNFLELTATGTVNIEAEVSIFTINGELLTTVPVKIRPGQQIDLDIHSIVGQQDTYGVIRIDFNDQTPGATLNGRMSNYRLDPDGVNYSFAFAKELRNPTRGITQATGNSYDPQGSGFLVPNWAEIINLDNKPRRFSYNLYNQVGVLLHSERITVPPLGERDIQAGHEFGEGVYLGEFVPHDGATQYFATITRYSSNSVSGAEAETYNFAIPLDSRSGTGDTQFASISNLTGGCWSQTNWVELTNTRAINVKANLLFKDSEGATVANSTVTLKPRNQVHLNASSLLKQGSLGSVEINSSSPGALISQSLVYFHDCEVNKIQSAYATPARIPGRDAQFGTLNTFLGIKNLLRAINTTNTAIEFNLNLKGGNTILSSQQHSLAGSKTIEFNLSSSGIFNTRPDLNGTIKVITNKPNQILLENIRLREIKGRIDFAMPTLVQ